MRSADGLIGRVIETGRWASRVLLVTDGASNVPVRLVRDGTPAIATGHGDGTIDLKTLEVGRNPFRRGDVLVTSGVGGVYPPDIPVAVVVRVEGDRTVAKPLADPGRDRFRDGAARSTSRSPTSRSSETTESALQGRRAMSRIAGSSRDVALLGIAAASGCRSLTTLAACLLALLPIVAELAARPRFRLPGADRLAAAAAGNVAGADRAAARPVQRSRRRPSDRPVDGPVDPDLPHLRPRSTAGSAGAITGWTGCSPPLAILFYTPAAGMWRGMMGSRDRPSPCCVPQLAAVGLRLSAGGAAGASPSTAGGCRDEKRRNAAADRHREQPGLHLHPARDGAGRRPGRARRALLAGRMAWISIAENERYKLLSESNRVQLRLIPPRRGWIVDRTRPADRDQPERLPGRPHPRPARASPTGSSPS